MTETHTPLPWRAGDGEIFGADDSVVCTVHWRSGDDRFEANLETIVHAVNSHHELIEALRGLLDEIGKSACADTILDSAAAGKAFAAIAEVDGRRG